MELFRIRRDIPFMRYALILNLISFLTFAAAVFFIVTRGLHLSIEFTGGSQMEVQYSKPADIDKARKAIEDLKFGEVQVQNFGSSSDLLVRLPTRAGVKSGEDAAKAFEAMCAVEQGKVSREQRVSDKGEAIDRSVCKTADGSEPLKLQRTEVVGPQVGSELAADGLKALLAVIVGIMVYLAFRFEWKFAVAAIIANLHDVVIILGFFAFFQWEFSLAVLAGVLAVLGYSVNESVVIFDRIREAFRKFRKMTTPEVIDHAITSTTSRTIITHGSTQIMVLAMLIWGGPTLHYFAVALTIGICFGIYSSVFVAAAIAMWLGVKREDLIKGPVAGKRDPNDPNAGAVV
jgi:preprotein translocase subunit SecF